MPKVIKSKSLARIPQAMSFLQVSRSTLYGLMDGGELAYVKIGKARRIPWTALISLVKRNTVSTRGARRED